MEVLILFKRGLRTKMLRWLDEWKKMQDMLFQYVLKSRGHWRKKDVRIGDPYDETLILPNYLVVTGKIKLLAIPLILF